MNRAGYSAVLDLVCRCIYDLPCRVRGSAKLGHASCGASLTGWRLGTIQQIIGDTLAKQNKFIQ